MKRYVAQMTLIQRLGIKEMLSKYPEASIKEMYKILALIAGELAGQLLSAAKEKVLTKLALV